jgi:hypothetical protein
LLSQLILYLDYFLKAIFFLEKRKLGPKRKTTIEFINSQVLESRSQNRLNSHQEDLHNFSSLWQFGRQLLQALAQTM